MNAASNLWMLYAFRISSGLIPAYVIERLFWEARGMTIQMVVYTEIVYAVTIVALEVPTGWLADRWGRKKLLVLSAALFCLEFLLLLFATQFWHFALVVFLAGVAHAASSGSENALLYDSLQQLGKRSSFERHAGRLNACDLGSALLAALCGGWLAGRFDLELNYWLSLVSALVALTIALLLVEPSRQGTSAQADADLPFRQAVAAAMRFFRANPGVRLVVMTGMVTGAAMSYMWEFWQLYADRIGVPVAWFGALSSALMLLQLPGNLLAHALAGKFRYRTLLIGICAVLTAGFAYAAASRDAAGVVAMLVVCLFAGAIEPLAAGYLQHRVDSAVRATVDSFRSLGEYAVHIAAGLGFGFCAARWDIFGGYAFIAVLCGGFLTWLLFRTRVVAP